MDETRRGFFRAAATVAGAAAGAAAAPGIGPGSGAPGNPFRLDAAREVARIACWSTRAWSIVSRSIASSTRSRRRSVRGTARASSRARGSIRHTRRGYWRTRRPRWRSSASIGHQGEDIVALENTRENPQHGRLHAVLVLPVAAPRPAAGLVQVGALSFACGHRSPRRAERVRRWTSTPTSKCASGTARRKSGTSCCPSGPRAANV